MIYLFDMLEIIIYPFDLMMVLDILAIALCIVLFIMYVRNEK